MFLLKIFISFLFLSYFAFCDLKKREVENWPIFVYFLVAVGFVFFDGVSLFPDLVYSCVWIVFVLIMYHFGFYGGADCKVFIVFCLMFPMQFILVLLMMFFFAVGYSMVGRVSFFNRVLEIERGVPLLVCFLIGFICVFVWF
jgi:Type IV leader peptidase family.